MINFNITKSCFIVPFCLWAFLPLNGQSFDPETGIKTYLAKKYLSFSVGAGSGNFDLSAESAFSNPENPKERLWTAEVSDVSTNLHMPQLSIKFGGWKGWQGLEMELSYVGQKIPSQIVYYDSHGQIYIPPTDGYPDGYYYNVEPQDSVDLDDGFLHFNLFSIGVTGYANILLSQTIKPYFGFGFSFGLNNIQSEYPGPGSFAAKNVMAAFGYNIKDAEKLNTTDFGIGFHIPFGIKFLFNENLFFNPEFRYSQSFLSFGSSDAYLKERDKGTLESFHTSIGLGVILK